jgi:hypothetical protein
LPTILRLLISLPFRSFFRIRFAVSRSGHLHAQAAGGRAPGAAAFDPGSGSREEHRRQAQAKAKSIIETRAAKACAGDAMRTYTRSPQLRALTDKHLLRAALRERPDRTTNPTCSGPDADAPEAPCGRISALHAPLSPDFQSPAFRRPQTTRCRIVIASTLERKRRRRRGALRLADRGVPSSSTPRSFPPPLSFTK